MGEDEEYPSKSEKKSPNSLSSSPKKSLAEVGDPPGFPVDGPPEGAAAVAAPSSSSSGSKSEPVPLAFEATAAKPRLATSAIKSPTRSAMPGTF